VTLLEAHDVAAVSRLECDRAERRGRPGPELPGLRDGAAGQLGAGQPRRKAEIVLDPAGGPGLAAECGALDYERVEPFRGAVDRGRKACRAGADDEQIGFFAAFELAAHAERAQYVAVGRMLQLSAAGNPHERRLLSVGQRLLVP
jgi:hypothetical protein